MADEDVLVAIVELLKEQTYSLQKLNTVSELHHAIISIMSTVGGMCLGALNQKMPSKEPKSEDESVIYNEYNNQITIVEAIDRWFKKNILEKGSVYDEAAQKEFVSFLKQIIS